MFTEEYHKMLKECRKNAPKVVSYLIRRIKSQEFNEEETSE